MIFFRHLMTLIKTRPLLPKIKNAFFNRVLWHFRICHRFIPDAIHRWRRLQRFLENLNKARISYESEAYQGRITCFLREESPNQNKVIDDWYDLAVGGLDVQFVPGNIKTMWKEPNVQILSEKLTACLSAAQKKLKNYKGFTDH